MKPKGYWTKERCHEEALKYSYRNEFKKNSCSAYLAAYNNKFLDEICSHMDFKPQTKLFWTKEKCQTVALKYTKRYDFNLNHKGAYFAAKINGWLDEICSHMEFNNYTFEQCHDAALNYNTMSAFRLNHWSLYDYSSRMGWLDDLSAHMKKPKSTKKWTYDTCKKEASKHKTRNDFRYNSNRAYQVSRINGWLDDICSHMVKKQVHNKRWIYEKCKEEALKYNTLSEIRKNSPRCYSVMCTNKWREELCKHMTSKVKPSGYWDYDNCKKEAAKYEKRSKLASNCMGAYMSCYINGWLDEFYPKKK